MEREAIVSYGSLAVGTLLYDHRIHGVVVAQTERFTYVEFENNGVCYPAYEACRFEQAPDPVYFGDLEVNDTVLSGSHELRVVHKQPNAVVLCGTDGDVRAYSDNESMQHHGFKLVSRGSLKVPR
jgi:hypothetical protein